MSLKYVLLGFLIHRESSGYSLHKRFFDTTRPLLPQVYRALNDLASAGLVTSKRTANGKLPERNIFSVTQAGHAEFEHWLRDVSNVEPIRETFLHKLWFAGLFDEGVVRAIVEAMAAKRKKELEYYQKLADGLDGQSPRFYRSIWNKLVWRLAFDYLLRRARAELEWAEAALVEIGRFASGKGSGK